MQHSFPLLDSLLGGETLTVEYKDDLDMKNKRGPMSAHTLAVSIMGIANKYGGHLLLGVSKAGITGLHSERQATPAPLAAEILNQFVGRPLVAFHEYSHDGKRIWAFHVDQVRQMPLQLVDGTFKIRTDRGNKQGPENLPFLISDLPQWQAERGIHTDFSSMPIRDLPWSQYPKFLNPLALDALQRRIDAGRTAPNLRTISTFDQQMEALELIGTVDGERVITFAGLLLFGSNEILRERVPAHQAQFQVFAPDGSLPYNLFTGRPGLEQNCLLLLATRLEELFQGIVPRREMMDGADRVDIPAYGDAAFREAMMNAFIHRDFTINEPVIIQMTTEQLLFVNPGGFYRDVNAHNILFHEPCSRNQRLALACAALNLMEKSGRGVDRIFWDQIRYLRPMPSYETSSDVAVRLVLPGGEGALDAIRGMLNHFSGEEDIRERVIESAFVYTLITEGAATRETLMEALPGLPPTWAKKAITNLIDAGLITPNGRHGRGQRMILSEQFQAERGRPDAFRHHAEISQEDQRRLVLEYVAGNGSITRREAAKELLRPADDSIYRLLKGMVEDGILVPTGKGASTKYVKA